MSDLFDFDKVPALYAVMGNPVEHSKSPEIHALFAQQFGMRIEYQRILVEPGGFSQAVDNFRANGGQGLNITLPFKLDAYALCDQRSQRAELAGAVNTLWFEDGAVHGDNTDGVGLKRDITINLACPINNKHVLVLGAGGAVRGVLGPLLEERPEALFIANRTVDKAVVLAGYFASLGAVNAGGFGDVSERQFDMVINGTAASLRDEVPPLPDKIFTDNALAYDMMYADKPTTFMQWAQQHGAAKTSDGLGMLVEQAAESFLIWHGNQPNTGSVIEALR